MPRPGRAASLRRYTRDTHASAPDGQHPPKPDFPSWRTIPLRISRVADVPISTGTGNPALGGAVRQERSRVVSQYAPQRLAARPGRGIRGESRSRDVLVRARSPAFQDTLCRCMAFTLASALAWAEATEKCQTSGHEPSCCGSSVPVWGAIRRTTRPKVGVSCRRKPGGKRQGNAVAAGARKKLIAP